MIYRHIESISDDPPNQYIATGPLNCFRIIFSNTDGYGWEKWKGKNPNNWYKDGWAPTDKWHGWKQKRISKKEMFIYFL